MAEEIEWKEGIESFFFSKHKNPYSQSNDLAFIMRSTARLVISDSTIKKYMFSV